MYFLRNHATLVGARREIVFKRAKGQHDLTEGQGVGATPLLRLKTDGAEDT